MKTAYQLIDPITGHLVETAQLTAEYAATLNSYFAANQASYRWLPVGVIQ